MIEKKGRQTLDSQMNKKIQSWIEKKSKWIEHKIGKKARHIKNRQTNLKD